MIAKKRAAVSSHVGRAAARTLGGASQPLAKRRVAGQPLDRTTERQDVPHGHEHAVAAVIGQEWQVPGLPADHREPRRHRLSPDGSVRLLEARQHEGVDGPVHPVHRRGADEAVHHDPVTEVGVLDALVHTTLRTCRAWPCRRRGGG